MLYKVSFDNFLRSKDFLEDQFIFEVFLAFTQKVLLEQINTRCSKISDPVRYD